MEVEYVVCYEATFHAIWLQNFISTLGDETLTSSSTMEVEYVVCYEATFHAIWL